MTSLPFEARADAMLVELLQGHALGSLGPARDAVFKWQLFVSAITAIGKKHVFQSVPRFQSVILRPESVSMWDGATSCICPTVPPAVPEAGSFQKKVEQLASKVEGNVRPKAGASWHFHGVFCFALKPCWASHMSRDRISKIVSWLFLYISSVNHMNIIYPHLNSCCASTVGSPCTMQTWDQELKDVPGLPRLAKRVYAEVGCRLSCP
jgi:hypothetical protein